MFGGKGYKIYSRWLDNAAPCFKANQIWRHHWRERLLPRITNADVHHRDHVPFAYVGIPDSSELSSERLWRHKLLGKWIPDPYEDPEKFMNDWEIEENRQRPENRNPYNLVP